MVEINAPYAVLLRAIAAGVNSGSVSAGLREAQGWHEVLRLAEWHRLGAVLYERLGGLPDTPDWVSRELEETYLRQLARSVLIRQTRDVVLNALAAAGISAMLLKGAALVEILYEDPATRDMGDLDILVPPDQLDAAGQALIAHGFGPESPTGYAKLRAHLLGRGWHHDLALVHASGLVPVELHRHIVNPRDRRVTFDAGELLMRAHAIAGPPPHLVPAAEDLLLHSCLHFSHGREIRSEGALAEVRDIVTILARHDIDWALFIENVRRYRAAGRAFLALFTLAQLGFEPPEAPVAALRPAGFDDRAGERFVRQRVLSLEVRVPFSDWPASIEGARTALMWSRRNLGSRAHLPAEAARPLLSRRGAAARVLAHTCGRPARVVRDLRLTRCIEEIV
jgi:hypothetical protein